MSGYNGESDEMESHSRISPTSPSVHRQFIKTHYYYYYYEYLLYPTSKIE